MARTLVLASLFAVLSSANAVATEITEAQVLYWSARVNAVDLNTLLAVVQRGPGEDWPEIVSAQFASPLPPGAQDKHAAFRSLSEQLAQKLETYELSVHTLSDAEFATRAAGLLALRDLIARHPSYVNWVLVDAINRVLWVNVSKRLVKQDLAPELAALVEPLASFRLDLHTFANVADAELSQKLLTDTERSAVDEVIFRALWTKLASGSTFPYASTLGEGGIYSLLHARHLELILVRYIGTDAYIHAALPRTLRYRQVVPDYSPTDDFRKILQATKDEPAEPTLGEHVTGNELKFHAVATLLSDVATGRIGERLLFSKGGAESR